MKKFIFGLILAVTFFMSPVVFAGNPAQSGQSGQSGQSAQVGQHHGNHHGSCHHHHHKKCGFFKKLKKKAKKVCKKVKKCCHKAYDSAQNKVMDTGVAIKKKLTCKKNRTWVKGYYTKSGKHVKGHWRKIKK